MGWIEHAVWWHVYPLGFVGAETGPGQGVRDGDIRHRLDHLSEWLDYVVELGANGLLLGPIFSSEDHGYDTVDHYRIDPRLGDEDDFSSLVEQCRARGLRLVLDGVFNHVGRSFPAAADVLARGAESRYRDWFRYVDEARTQLAGFEGHENLVLLDHDNPEVVEHVVGVLRYWLDRGVDGWRFDAAYALPLPFLDAVCSAARATHPDAWLLGEVIHGDYPRWVREGGLDSVTQYELWKAIWSSLRDGNFFELAWALDRHATVLEELLPYTFLGNHDVTRLASVLDDHRLLGHALAILLTVGGIPGVYYGDEQALRGVKEDRVGGDDEIRPAFPRRPDELPASGWSTHRLHQHLIGLRRRHPWLVRAAPAVLHLANEQLAYRLADPHGRESLLVLLNVAEEPFAFPLGEMGAAGEVTGVPAASSLDDDPARAGEVEGRGWKILTTGG